jgi:hypothetical protein
LPNWPCARRPTWKSAGGRSMAARPMTRSTISRASAVRAPT